MDAAPGLTPLLIDAKREYVGQLTDVLAPFVINYVQALYLAAVQQHRNAATLAFQRGLRDIPQWNAPTVAQRTSEIQGRYSFLGDLIAACFVAYVKILSSVKLHQQKPNIRLRLPANDVFVHKVYVHTAREFYANPALVKADRAAKTAVVRAAVEASVRDMLPIEDILKAYLGNTIDSTDHTMNPGEMVDDGEGAEEEHEVDGMQMMHMQQQPGMMAMQPGMLAVQQQPMLAVQQQPMLAVQQQQPVVAVQPVMAAAAVQQPVQQQPMAAAAPQPMMAAAPQQVAPAAAEIGGGLVGDFDEAPKQISIGQPQQQLQPQQFAAQAAAGGQDLFSDAEDEF